MRRQPGSAAQFEWSRCAAAFTEVRAFEQALTRIDQGRLERRHVRRRNNPRQKRLVEIEIAPPATTWNDVKHDGDSSFRHIELCKLADRQAMTRRYGMNADKALEARLNRWAFDRYTIERIRPIENHHGQII